MTETRRCRPIVVLLAIAAGIGLAACGTLPQEPLLGTGIDAAQLREGAALLRSSPAQSAAEDDLLAVNEAMRDFVRREVDADAPAPRRLHQLLEALTDERRFGLRYTDDTLTAAEAFARRAGNCLSFTAMFVALAREAGLLAEFQQVDLPPSWERQDDTLMLREHVNAVVTVGRPSTHPMPARQVVDFNAVANEGRYPQRPMSDARARAHYHGNLAVAELRRNRLSPALRRIQQGLAADPEHAPLWVNLGAIYSRAGLLGQAEASYLQALRRDPQQATALGNLARLYAHVGAPERAAAYRERVRSGWLRNPYYRADQARLRLEAGDADGALGHLRHALRRKPDEAAFHRLAGQAEQTRGRPEAAQRHFDTARRLAAATPGETLYASRPASLNPKPADRRPME